MTTQKKSNWAWPAIEDRESAAAASKSGMWAAFIVAVVTALVATLAMAMQKAIVGIDAWAYLDAGIFAVIAWGIKQMSRAAAVIGLVLFIVERIDMAVSQHNFSILSILLLLMFINGVRGAFGYHRYAKDEPETESA